MNYNDYPILDDEQYDFLKNKYLQQKNFNRDEAAFYIYSDLLTCHNACPMLITKLNKFLRASLNECQAKLKELIENFEATFNYKKNKIEIKEINLFNFLKKLVNLQKNLINWQKLEQKEYFIQLINNFLKEINEMLISTLSALENSNVPLFRFM